MKSSVKLGKIRMVLLGKFFNRMDRKTELGDKDQKFRLQTSSTLKLGDDNK